MALNLNEFDDTSKITDLVTLQALSKFLDQTAVETHLQQYCPPGMRVRKLNLFFTFLILLNGALYRDKSLAYIIFSVSSQICLLLQEKRSEIPSVVAFVYRKNQLPVKALQTLFHDTCKPLTTPCVQGGYFSGLRLLGIDGTCITGADTDSNYAHFGKASAPQGESAYPKGQAVFLVDLGSHAIIDATLDPYKVSETKGFSRILKRGIGQGDLILGDRRVISAERLKLIIDRQADAVLRLPEGHHPIVIKTLSDGSQLVDLYKAPGRKPLRVRLIRYQLAFEHPDKEIPDEYRLITTLLDSEQYPASEIAHLYHERWECETTNRECKTYLHRFTRPFRSKTYVGVLQEFYALLLAHYAVCKLRFDAASKGDLDPDRLSYTHCLRVLQDHQAHFDLFSPSNHGLLYEHMIASVLALPLSPRKVRFNPRKLKKTAARYPSHKGEKRQRQSYDFEFKDVINIIKNNDTTDNNSPTESLF